MNTDERTIFEKFLFVAREAEAHREMPQQRAREEQPIMTAQHIQTALHVWNTLETKARKRFPHATKDELFTVTKQDMNKALAEAAVRAARRKEQAS